MWRFESEKILLIFILKIATNGLLCKCWKNCFTSFTIGDYQLTIREYIVDFIQHDYHHKNQIEVLLS